MTNKRRGPITAAELMAELESDDEWVEQRRKEEERRLEIDAVYQRAEVPLVAALGAAGFPVESVWDLVNRAEPYPEAIPILLEHLQRDYPDRVKEGIARSLAVPDARDAWPILLELFEANDDTTGMGSKCGIACALDVTSDDDVIDDVIRLVRDKRHGMNRLILLESLARSKREDAQATLRDMRDDPDMREEVDHILKKRSRRSRR